MLPGLGQQMRVKEVAGNARADEAPPAESAATVKPVSPSSSLAAFVRGIYNRAADHKVSQGVERRFLRALRARSGERDDAAKAALREIGLDEDLSSQITDVKCNSAKAQLDEVYVNGPNDEFTVTPTPVPEISEGDGIVIFGEMMKAVMLAVVGRGAVPTPQEIFDEVMRRYDDRMAAEMRVAKERVARMEKKMRDQLEEGGFREAKAGYVNDVVTYGTGIIEGPVESVETRLCSKRSKVGTVVFGREARPVLKFVSRSPWDVYPAPESKKVGDSPLCIIERYSGSELDGFVKSVSGESAAGWNAAEVRKILADHPKGWKETRNGLNSERRRLEGNGGEGVFCGDGWSYEALKMYAVLRGSVLIENGAAAAAKQKIEAGTFYMAEVVTLADRVVRCRLQKDMRIPVSKGVFYDVPGSFWGRSIADRCVPAQNIQDSCLYWIKVNMGMCSLPMFYARDFTSLLDKGPGALDIKAGKFWAMRGSGLGVAGGPPIGTVEVASHIAEILAAMDRSKIMADDDTGIPAHSYGGASSASGVARTASGLKMLTESAMRGMRMVIGQTDKEVIENILTMLYERNMLRDPDPSIKGDAQIMARGVMGRVLREQEKDSQMQFLTMVSTNVNLFQLVGPRAVAVILRKLSEGMGIPEFMPSDTQLEDAELMNKIKQLAEIEGKMAGRQAGAGVQGAGSAEGHAAAGMGGGGGQMPQIVPDATGAAQGGVAERRGAA